MQPLTIQFWMDGSGSINFSPLPFEILKKPTDILFWEWFHVEVKTGHTPAGTVDEIKKFWYDNVFTAVAPSTDEASDLTMEIIGSLLGMFGDQPLKKSQTWSGHPIRKRYKFQGINISIENPAGTLRTGKDPDGKKWRSLLHFDYGYILGTDGKAPDGDLLDCFIGANKDSDKVFVIHQKHVKTGKFDEDKVMLGWLNKTDAVRDYLKNYNRSDMYSGVSVMTIDEFKKKAYATTKKPMMIKAKVRSHTRSTKTDGVVNVREYETDLLSKKDLKMREEFKALVAKNDIIINKKSAGTIILMKQFAKESKTFEEFLKKIDNIKNSPKEVRYKLFREFGATRKKQKQVPTIEQLLNLFYDKNKNHKDIMIKSKIKAHPRKMKSGKIVQVREHQDSRTKNSIMEDKRYKYLKKTIENSIIFHLLDELELTLEINKEEGREFSASSFQSGCYRDTIIDSTRDGFWIQLFNHLKLSDINKEGRYYNPQRKQENENKRKKIIEEFFINAWNVASPQLQKLLQKWESND